MHVRFCTVDGEGGINEWIACEENGAVILGERHARGSDRYRRIPMMENDSPVILDGKIRGGFISLNGSLFVTGTPVGKSPETLRKIESRESLLVRVNTKGCGPSKRNGFYRVLSGEHIDITHASPVDRKTDRKWMDGLLAITGGTTILISPMGAEQAFLAEFSEGALRIKTASSGTIPHESGLRSSVRAVTV